VRAPINSEQNHCTEISAPKIALYRPPQLAYTKGSQKSPSPSQLYLYFPEWWSKDTTGLIPKSSSLLNTLNWSMNTTVLEARQYYHLLSLRQRMKSSGPPSGPRTRRSVSLPSASSLLPELQFITNLKDQLQAWPSQASGGDCRLVMPGGWVRMREGGCYTRGDQLITFFK
jgi:hypothetical protein